MNVYQVIVIYQHTDGRQVQAEAIVAAYGHDGALRSAAAAVRELPHCAEIVCGWCEDVTDKVVPPHARADSIPEPATATRH